MASNELGKFYSETCKRIESLESEKRALLERQKGRGKSEAKFGEVSAEAATIRAQCVSERFQRLETFHSEFRLIEGQLNQRLKQGASDRKAIESEILHWKKRFLTRTFIWQAAITQDHWYFTRSLIHLFIGNICGRHPLFGIENHLQPLVDPAEQDTSKWDDAFRTLSSRNPLPGLLFMALQTAKPSPAMYPPYSKKFPVDAYSGLFADRVSTLLGLGKEVNTEAGLVPGGTQTFVHLFGKDAEGEFVRFLVICNAANDYVLVDFSQSQAARGALLQMIRSPSIEKIVWNKDAVFKALQCSLWIRSESFNEVYDLSIPWMFGSGTTANDIRFIDEVSEYLRVPQAPPPSSTAARDGELARIAAALFHTKELGDISGSSIIDLVLNDKADWIMNDAAIGWERIDPKVRVSLAVTATTLSDVAIATAILNPNWRMALNACPSILATAIERFLLTAEVPTQCLVKVTGNTELPFPKCRYQAECLHDFVFQAEHGSLDVAHEQKADDQALADIQLEINNMISQKADLERIAPYLKRGGVDGGRETGLLPHPSIRSVPLLMDTPPERFEEPPPLPRGPVIPDSHSVPFPGYDPGIGYQQFPPIPPFIPTRSNPAPAVHMPHHESRHGQPETPGTVGKKNSGRAQLDELLSALLPQKAVDREVAFLKKEEIPPWVRSFIIPKLPLYAERGEEWAKIPVPRLTMPAYFKTLGENDPLSEVLAQWRRDYVRTISRWKRGDPWGRISIFLGALATDAQILACRVVQRLANRSRKRQQPTTYTRAGLVGLLTEFCAFVEEVTHFDSADYREIRQQQAELKRAMETALAEQTQGSASSPRGRSASGPGTGKKNKGKKTFPNIAIIPKDMRLFYSLSDLYPLAIIPALTFAKLNDGVYRGRCHDQFVSPCIGSQPHPSCDLLPSEIIPPKTVILWVQNHPDRLSFPEYNPFDQTASRQAENLEYRGKGGHGDGPVSKKARLDDGDGDGAGGHGTVSLGH